MATQHRRGGAQSSARQEPEKQPEKQHPVHTIQRGRVRAALWRHQGSEGDWFSVTFARSYKDGQGNWKSASSFGRDDLLTVAELARRCWDWIFQELQASKGGDAYEGTQAASDAGEDTHYFPSGA